MAIEATSFLKPIERLERIETLTGTEKTEKTGAETDFEKTLKEKIQEVRDLESASNQLSYDLAMGKTDDLTSVMIATTKAQTAIELTTQVTTRAVNAYKEIMQMNI
ncbi:MAG: flagellar hook-basal body complex protein FliE [Oscillospiraceae bacterium]|nr:flagellar hook-basal body complex protein FliE [Oscillospiraceae bacterium]MBQ8378898.1 flagellar hook-basal body complex protein FliE [Oscillospiraceae bacterium]MBQ8883033.1 flagellar hook-basal body complex protein FliE [Oscillospiraceae bacterium]